eukprot:scaffold144705_cov14-Tisochrysis_lutea.AAC.1
MSAFASAVMMGLNSLLPWRHQSPSELSRVDAWHVATFLSLSFQMSCAANSNHVFKPFVSNVFCCCGAAEHSAPSNGRFQTRCDTVPLRFAGGRGLAHCSGRHLRIPCHTFDRWNAGFRKLWSRQMGHGLMICEERDRMVMLQSGDYADCRVILNQQLLAEIKGYGKLRSEAPTQMRNSDCTLCFKGSKWITYA